MNSIQNVLKKWEEKIKNELTRDVTPEEIVKKILLENKEEFKKDCELIEEEVSFCCIFLINRANSVYEKNFGEMIPVYSKEEKKRINICNTCVRDPEHEGCFEICKSFVRSR
ncbi:MAG TPA: hypothetical protein PLE28_01585 [bacterium]|nr:hypothetical protein [bacterium]